MAVSVHRGSEGRDANRAIIIQYRYLRQLRERRCSGRPEARAPRSVTVPHHGRAVRSHTQPDALTHPSMLTITGPPLLLVVAYLSMLGTKNTSLSSHGSHAARMPLPSGSVSASEKHPV